MAGNSIGQVQTVFDQTLSCKGPLVIPVRVDFTAFLTTEIDLSAQVSQNFIDYISCVYVDNKDGAFPIDIICSGTLSRHTILAHSQVFMPLLALNPPKFACSTTGILGIYVPMYFSNIPWIPFVNGPL